MINYYWGVQIAFSSWICSSSLLLKSNNKFGSFKTYEFYQLLVNPTVEKSLIAIINYVMKARTCMKISSDIQTHSMYTMPGSTAIGKRTWRRLIVTNQHDYRVKLNAKSDYDCFKIRIYMWFLGKQVVVTRTRTTNQKTLAWHWKKTLGWVNVRTRR